MPLSMDLRKREYVLVKHHGYYYYCKLSNHDPDLYLVMAEVRPKEGKEVIQRANMQSEYNKYIDVQLETNNNGDNQP